MKKNVISLVILGMVLMLLVPTISAGVGISWDKESSLVPENTKTCLTYKIYNPWPEDVYSEISLSEELDQIVQSQESEVKLIPGNTFNSEAIPVQFCFKTPRIYERDCWIGNSLICKQECNEEMKVFEGNVIAKEVTNPDLGSAAQGSITQMSVSAPLRVRVQCISHDRNYSFIYIVVALIAAILLGVSLRRKKNNKKKKK